MSAVLVCAKDQVVLPAALRRRQGLNPGARLEVTEAADGRRRRLQRSVPTAAASELAGMVTAPPRGRPRRLSDFDAAALSARTPR